MKKNVLIFVLAILSYGFTQGQNQKFLKPISGGEKLTIDPTTGKEKASDKDVFLSTDQNFKNWNLDQVAPPTNAVSLEIFSLNGEASFDEIFKSDAEKEKAALTMPQIRKVVAKYADGLKDGNVYFLIKVGNKFYIVQTSTKADGISLETWQTGDYLSFGSRDKFIAPIK
jgi:hypothetical protein